MTRIIKKKLLLIVYIFVEKCYCLSEDFSRTIISYHEFKSFETYESNYISLVLKRSRGIVEKYRYKNFTGGKHYVKRITLIKEIVAL